MCINKKRFFTKSHILSLDSFQPGYFEADCCECSECLEKRQQDYFVRSYYEAKSCIDHGGFVLFDTLTYRDQDLPHISDFISDVSPAFDYPCFSRRDIQLFFKRLRKHFSSSGLRFFLASEYGSSEFGTHRPHYHIILYVYDHVSPYDVSCLVDRCWQKGRTDGVPYNGWFYVKSKRVFQVSPDDFHFNNVIKYVQKYTLKNSSFQSEIDKRLFALCSADRDQFLPLIHSQCPDFNVLVCDGWSPLEYIDTSIDRDKFKKYKRLVSQFIDQSLGYGAQWLNDHSSVSDFETNGFLTLVNDCKKKRFTLPSYLYRKLYYETYVNAYGKKAWRLNERGVNARLKMLSHRLQACQNAIKSAMLSSSLSLSDSQIRELSIYKVVYRGTLSRNLVHSSPEFDYLSRFSVSPTGQILYNHNSFSAVSYFGKRFVSCQDYGVSGAYVDAPLNCPLPPESVGDLLAYYDPPSEKILHSLGLVSDVYKRSKDRVYFYKKNLLEMLQT